VKKTALSSENSTERQRRNYSREAEVRRGRGRFNAIPFPARKLTVRYAEGKDATSFLSLCGVVGFM
jgi:hypothetical protein